MIDYQATEELPLKRVDHFENDSSVDAFLLAPPLHAGSTWLASSLLVLAFCAILSYV